MQMKKLFSLFLAQLLVVLSALAQRPVELLESGTLQHDKMTITVKSVQLISDSILVLNVDQFATEDKAEYDLPFSDQTVVEAGADSFRLLSRAALQQGTMTPTDLEMTGRHAWKDVKANNNYPCLLMFVGHIKSDVTKLVVKETGRNIELPLRIVNPKSANASKMPGEKNAFLLVRNNGTAQPATVEVENDSRHKLVFVVGGEKYTIKPHKALTIKLPTGKVSFEARSKGIPSMNGTQEVKAGDEYRWTYRVVQQL